jgi:hypothetical protein
MERIYHSPNLQIRSVRRIRTQEVSTENFDSIWRTKLFSIGYEEGAGLLKNQG